jgi:hypothetical protein
MNLGTLIFLIGFVVLPLVILAISLWTLLSERSRRACRHQEPAERSPADPPSPNAS